MCFVQGSVVFVMGMVQGFPKNSNEEFKGPIVRDGFMCRTLYKIASYKLGLKVLTPLQMYTFTFTLLRNMTG